MNKKKILKSRLCCRVHYNDNRDFKKLKSVFNKKARKKLKRIVKEAVKVIIKAFNMLAEQTKSQIDTFVASKDYDTGRLVNVANKDFTQRFKQLDKPVFKNECYITIESEEK